MPDIEWNALVQVLERLPVENAVDAQGNLVNLEAIRILYTLAKSVNAKTVLEVGVEHGYSALTWAFAGVETILGVEIDPSLPSTDVKMMIQAYSTDLFMCYGDSLDVPVPQTDLDILFIDGAKTRTLDDFDRFAGWVRPGGLIIVDDWPCFWSVIQARNVLEKRGYHFMPLVYGNEFGRDGGNSRLVYRVPSEMEKEIAYQTPIFESSTPPEDQVDGYVFKMRERN